MTLIYWNKLNICHIQVFLLPFIFESSAFKAMHVGNNRKVKEESWKGRKIKQTILQQMLLLKEYVKKENAIPDSPIDT